MLSAECPDSPASPDPPKVSVLLIAFNSAAYIDEAITSALSQQTTFSYEVVACDDGSTDGTRDIMGWHARQAPERVRLVFPDQNLGAGGSAIFVRGWQACRGDYVAPLDGDDYWTDPEKLQLQATFLDTHPECFLCFHNSRILYEDDRRRPWNLHPWRDSAVLGTEELLGETSIHNSSSMFRREALGEFLDWGRTMGLDTLTDWGMAILASRRGKAGYCARVMAAYRQRRAGLWAGMDRADQLATIIQRYEVMDRYLGLGHHDAIERAAALRRYEAALEYERKGDLAHARLYLARCLGDRSRGLENHVAGLGWTGDRFWRMLAWRHTLYGYPALHRLASRLLPRLHALSWRWRSTAMMLRKFRRLMQRRTFGLISADPNPIRQIARPPGLGITTLTWISNAEAAEVRVGRPDGPLFDGTGPCGRQTTGEWVRHGMLFYLQDVSHGRPCTVENTLDVVRVTVVSEQ